MARRAAEDEGRLTEDMTEIGVLALISVVLDDSLDHGKVLQQLQFMRKLKFNKDFDLISQHDIQRHFARNGVEQELA